MTKPVTLTPERVDELAAAAADAFFEACGEPDRWAALPDHKRATFRLIVGQVVATAKSYKGVTGLDLTPMLGRAASDAFLAGPDCPRWLQVRYDWRTGAQRDEARPIFLAVAQAIVARGQAIRANARAA